MTIDRHEQLSRALKFYGLPSNYSRIYMPNGNGSVYQMTPDQAATRSTYAWIQINLTDPLFPHTKPENKDITVLQNIALDWELPSNPSLAHEVGEQFASWIATTYYPGIDVKLPLEDTGAGCHIVIPIDPLSTAVYGGGDVVNRAVKMVIEGEIRQEFYRICNDHGVQMSLGAYDLSRLLSAPGTYRPGGNKPDEISYLVNGYVRRYTHPFDQTDPERVYCSFLRDLIIEKTDDAWKALGGGTNSTGGGAVPNASNAAPSANHDPAFVRWLNNWVNRNPNATGNRSDYFHRMVCAAYRRMHGSGSIIIDHADIIDDLSGSKYTTRAAQEAQRSIQAIQMMNPKASVTTKSGYSIQDYIDALTSLGYEFKLNMCGNDIEANGVKLNDYTDARICNQMYDLGFANESIVHRVWKDLAESNSYHPVLDYLEQCREKYLTSGSSGYIAILSSHFVTNEDVIDKDGNMIVYTWLRKWLIGAVAKAIKQEQNFVLVLEGPQDIGKSTFARWLAKDIPQYHIEQAINLNKSENDSNIRLTKKFVWEIGELGATTNRQDVEAVKDFITRRTVTVRKPYGHHDVELFALASHIGTVNETGGGFLSDPTGNRRFVTIPALSIDHSYFRSDPSLVWGEAVDAFYNGEDWRIRGEMVQIRDRINTAYTVTEPLVEIIQKNFHISNGASKERMLATDIMNYLHRKGFIKSLDKPSAIRTGIALRKLGIKKKRGSDDRWFYEGITPLDLSEEIDL